MTDSVPPITTRLFQSFCSVTLCVYFSFHGLNTQNLSSSATTNILSLYHPRKLLSIQVSRVILNNFSMLAGLWSFVNTLSYRPSLDSINPPNPWVQFERQTRCFVKSRALFIMPHSPNLPIFPNVPGVDILNVRPPMTPCQRNSLSAQHHGLNHWLSKSSDVVPPPHILYRSTLPIYPIICVSHYQPIFGSGLSSYFLVLQILKVWFSHISDPQTHDDLFCSCSPCL